MSYHHDQMIFNCLNDERSCSPTDNQCLCEDLSIGESDDYKIYNTIDISEPPSTELYELKYNYNYNIDVTVTVNDPAIHLQLHVADATSNDTIPTSSSLPIPTSSSLPIPATRSSLPDPTSSCPLVIATNSITNNEVVTISNQVYLPFGSEQVNGKSQLLLEYFSVAKQQIATTTQYYYVTGTHTLLPVDGCSTSEEMVSGIT